MEAKNNKKTIWAWSMFDWANQSYNMVITSTIFPAYYVYYTTFHNPNHDIVTFFGHKYVNTVLQINMLGLSYLIIVVTLPILTSIADYRGNKKRRRSLLKIQYLPMAASAQILLYHWI